MRYKGKNKKIFPYSKCLCLQEGKEAPDARGLYW